MLFSHTQLTLEHIDGLGVRTLCAMENPWSVLMICGSASMDSNKQRLHRTAVFLFLKSPHTHEPTQFKLVSFKGQYTDFKFFLFSTDNTNTQYFKFLPPQRALILKIKPFKIVYLHLFTYFFMYLILYLPSPTLLIASPPPYPLELFHLLLSPLSYESFKNILN